MADVKFTENADGTVRNLTTQQVVLYGLEALNMDAARRFVQVFDVPAASVTLGTTKPVLSIGMGSNGNEYRYYDGGILFPAGLSYACTTTDTGNTGASAAATISWIVG